MPRLAAPLLILVIVILSMAAVVHAQPEAPAAHDTAPPHVIERGRYIVKIAGCNDCHTPGYGESGGTVPEFQWLTGDVLGWRGPWGTTYPIRSISAST